MGNLQPKPLHHFSAQICHICSDGVGLIVDREFFFACNECAFPICRTCYESEQSEGNQVCSQCKMRFQCHKGKCSGLFLGNASLHSLDLLKFLHSSIFLETLQTASLFFLVHLSARYFSGFLLIRAVLLDLLWMAFKWDSLKMVYMGLALQKLRV